MKKAVIIGTSLNVDSRSQELAQIFEEKLTNKKVDVCRFDMREFNLPFAGASGSWDSEETKKIHEEVVSASHIVFSVPIYCYDVNAVAKNIIELIGHSFTDKVIGFICSAGGSSSYMSVMGFANHLMLDFRSVIVPRFVYAEDKDWSEGQVNEIIKERFDLLIDDLSAIQIARNEQV
ncbi:hypothetical protein LNTAR_21335 [Lentisphaera araneosa HTCC2155]|uniref:NADPH-dependent FMN reductase-like domain-containing protein n=1 Tax=Lentisphaera araneosa HTCC2155 TaxID=313628 RepID=A6DM01_9BACT|nr:NAD(P)H-dependent oxidoreductase [Lentisphaera araneosa]EDM27299.1 hypothetical protein LNTAR_21335 [Lentisphaera araneosa HTCC2155]